MTASNSRVPARSRLLRTGRLLALLMSLAAASLAAAGCDIVTADLRSEETAQWQKTYTLDAGGRVEIANVNGKITVEPSTGNIVDIKAFKKARAATPESAKAALERASIVEDVTGGRVKIDTKIARAEGLVFNGMLTVDYTVKVPIGAEVKFATINGGIEISGLEGRITAETTNGGVVARSIKGQLDASTTNGGLEIDLAAVPSGGVKLECTNGGIKVTVPRDARATISASVANGGISQGDLPLEIIGESTRRRLEGRLNGGGPRIQVEGTNGGITLGGR